MSNPAPDPRRTLRLLLPVLLAVLFFAVYAKTACRAGYWQDAGLYLRSVYLLGNCYSPGYPVYLCFSYIFTALPALGAAAGLNLASALWGAAAAFFVASVALRLLGDDGFGAAGAAAATIALGAAPAVWAQATAAEVYTMNLALAAATFFALLSWGGGEDRRPLWLAAFVYGLACGVHPQQAAFLPAYLLYIFWTGGRRAWSLRTWAVAVALFALALSAYLYLPIRSFAGVMPDWGKPRTLHNLYYHVTGKAYRGELFAAPPAMVAVRAGLAARVFLSQFEWVGVAAGALGMVALFRRNRKAALAVLLAAALATLFILNYFSANWRTWYTPAYFAWALAIGAGVAGGARLLARWRRPAAAAFAAAAVVAAAVAIPARFGPADRSYFPYADTAAADVFRTVGPRATFLLSYEGSALNGPMGTLTTTAGARPDVRFIDMTGARTFDDFFDQLGDRYRYAPQQTIADRFLPAFRALVSDPGRDYYMFAPLPAATAFGARYEKRAQVWRLRMPGQVMADADWWGLYLDRAWEGKLPSYLDYWTATSYGVRYVNEARDRVAAGEMGRAARCIDLAARYGARSEVAQNNLGSYWWERGDFVRAQGYCRRALAADPTYEKSRRNLVMLYYRTGDDERAARELETWRRLFPSRPGTRASDLR